MLLLTLLLVPLVGILIILTSEQVRTNNVTLAGNGEIALSENAYFENSRSKQIKQIALSASIINLFISLIIFILFDFSSNQFQFVQEYHEVSYFHIYLGVDGLSIYFVLLTTIITPISLLSN